MRRLSVMRQARQASGSLLSVSTMSAAPGRSFSPPHLFGRQERDFLPQRLRAEIGRLPLRETGKLKGGIGKARRYRAFSARLHMSAENVNAWWWMQSGSNLS